VPFAATLVNVSLLVAASERVTLLGRVKRRSLLPLQRDRRDTRKLELIQCQVEQRDHERAAEQQQEEGEQAPTEQEALAGGLVVGVVHAIKGSTAIATKSSAR